MLRLIIAANVVENTTSQVLAEVVYSLFSLLVNLPINNDFRVVNNLIMPLQLTVQLL